MNILKLSRNVAMTLGVVLGAITSAQAVPILTFGQVGQANVVTATRVGANTSINANNAAVSITQIDAAVVTPINAFLTFDFDNTAAVVFVGPVITQTYSGDFCISSAINCGGTRYLFGDFVDITFGLGSSLALTATTPPQANVNFFSDVIANLDFDRGVGFSFANVTPALGVTMGSINSFTSSVSGVFSANIGVIPEPETAALLMMGLVAVGLARRRPKSRD
jgi:PEP-CTERM motif